jgi:chromosome segregation ATPase
MDFENFEKLEAKIADLTERMLALKESHQQMARELENRQKQLGQLNEKVAEFDVAREKINSRIEALLRRLEVVSASEP